MKTKETYLEKVEAQLRVWGERIDQLTTQAKPKPEPSTRNN